MRSPDLTKIKLAGGAVAIRQTSSPFGVKTKKAYWLVRCACGEYFTARQDNLRKGTQCKCLACLNDD